MIVPNKGAKRSVLLLSSIFLSSLFFGVCLFGRGDLCFSLLLFSLYISFLSVDISFILYCRILFSLTLLELV